MTDMFLYMLTLETKGSQLCVLIRFDNDGCVDTTNPQSEAQKRQTPCVGCEASSARIPARGNENHRIPVLCQVAYGMNKCEDAASAKLCASYQAPAATYGAEPCSLSLFEAKLNSSAVVFKNEFFSSWER